MLLPHPMAAHYTPDEIAETLDGISQGTYARLWSLLPAAQAKPMGGDGSDGTREWPEATERAESVLAIWPLLTEAERAEINAALSSEEAA